MTIATPAPKKTTGQVLAPKLMKVGAQFFSACVDTEDGKVVITFRDWRIKTIKNSRRSLGAELVPTAYLVDKVDNLTWGRKSTKTGDYGWLDGIEPYYRVNCCVGDELPKGLATTKEKALRRLLVSQKERFERNTSFVMLGETDEDRKAYADEYNAEVAAIQRQIKSLKTRAATAKKRKAELTSRPSTPLLSDNVGGTGQ